MHPSPQSAEIPPRASEPGLPRTSASAERAYQGLTIAFMLLLLASLWLFR